MFSTEDSILPVFMVVHESPIDRTYQYLLIAAFFFLPITVLGNNIAIWVIVILWFFSGNYREKFQQIKNHSLALASILFFLIHILALIWTENLDWGFEMIRKMLPFLFVLPAFLSICRIENMKYYITAFLIAIAISVGLSYLVWFGIIEPFKYAAGIENPVPLMSHTSYNPFLAFAFYLVVNKLLYGGKMSQLERVLYTFFALTMTFNMFITGGRAGQVMFFAAIVVLVFQYFKNSQVKAITVSFILIFCISFTAYFSSPLFKQRVEMVFSEIGHYNVGEPKSHENAASKNTSMGYRITFFINTAELIKKSPILGVGTGDFPAEYEKINNIRSQDVVPTVQPHNMYLLVWAQLGILGLISLLWIFYVQFKIALSSSNKFVRHVGVAMPIFFLIIMWSDSYLLGHHTGNLFILFSSLIYSNR